MSPFQGRPLVVTQVVRLPADAMVRLHVLVTLTAQQGGRVMSRLVQEDRVALTFVVPVPMGEAVEIIEPDGRAHPVTTGPAVLTVDWALAQAVPA